MSETSNTPKTTSATPAPAVRKVSMHEVVIVDSSCEHYGDFVRAAQDGEIGLHFCVDGRSAVRLARRFRADVWLLATELPDMSGFDLLEGLASHVLHGDVDPLLSGARISLDRLGQTMRSGIFMVSDAYRLEDEQRALAGGVAGFLVRPLTIDLIRAARQPHEVIRHDSDIIPAAHGERSL